MALDAPVREWDDGCLATSEETTEKNSQFQRGIQPTTDLSLWRANESDCIGADFETKNH